MGILPAITYWHCLPEFFFMRVLQDEDHKRKLIKRLIN